MSATNIPSACRIANIAQNDAMILPMTPIQAGWNFRKGHRMTFSERTGNFGAGTGNLTCQNRNHRRIKFSAHTGTSDGNFDLTA
jgi:hypothetical protein